ncbi:uncharacterized protein BX663DRAFT_499958 [Cokeromyces recurvatus]|uniref:uncharacterized protein n=1 Tax=Cokeromyces recurvatus TaxID=90255 RepID=UPI00221F7328|nr:uncharacterized protein BX663DRAFT_499958 [Cokeromyces recurvatus]KAI7905500.1 hypothetical protein BX663DRAFT_499958 [Cokeromyces recurvatus]
MDIFNTLNFNAALVSPTIATTDANTNTTSTTSTTMATTTTAAAAAPNNQSFDEYHPLSNCNSNAFPTPTSIFSSANTEFNFNQDLVNFDIASSNNQQASQNTPLLDPMFNFTKEEDPAITNTTTTTITAAAAAGTLDLPKNNNNNANFTRRHSVAISGGFNDFDLRQFSSSLFENDYTKTSPYLSLEQELLLTSEQRQFKFPAQSYATTNHPKSALTAVIENEAHIPSTHHTMLHRASMPNIFLTETSCNQLSNMQKKISSATTTPNSTPPPPPAPAPAPISITFNQMPWSDTSQISPIQKDDPNQEDNNYLSTNSFLSTIHDYPLATGRKRFYSQQLDSFPDHTLSTQQQTSWNHEGLTKMMTYPNLCPLPMSGILSRRSSVATPLDISTWNRKVNSNHRIQLLNQPKQVLLNYPKRKRVKEDNDDDDDDDENENEGREKEKEMNPVLESNSSSSSLSPIDDSITTTTATAEDYPIITEADLKAAKKDPNAIPRRQKLRFEDDQYTPKWVRYTGQMKEGYCDTCKPGKWLQLKNSAFWYHKQFYHGISSVSGKPFENPLEQRAGEHDVVEGLCHQCKQFVPICNSKRKNSVLWYRHAHKCHIYDKPKSKGNKRASIAISSKKYQLHDQLQKIY